MICTGGSSAVKGVILRCGCLNMLRLDKLRTNPEGKHGSLTTFCQTAGVSRLPYAAFAHLASNCWNPLRAAYFSLVWLAPCRTLDVCCCAADRLGREQRRVLAKKFDCSFEFNELCSCNHSFAPFLVPYLQTTLRRAPTASGAVQ